MNASSQPAYLRLPFRLAFSVTSARARFSAILRRSARLRAAFRSRTRLASSRKVTSSTQCSPFCARHRPPRVWVEVPAPPRVHPSPRPPVAPDRGRQRLRRELGAREVVADLGFHLSPAGGGAAGLDPPPPGEPPAV